MTPKAFLLGLAAIACSAQTDLPPNHYLGADRIHELPPDRQRIGTSAKAPVERIYWQYGSTPRGIVIAGVAPKIDPALAEVEIWLAGPNDPDIPPPGWHDRFQTSLFRSESQCAGYPFPDKAGLEKCRTWVRLARASQAQMRRLFARRYVWSAGKVREAWSTSALASLQGRFVPDTQPGREVMPGFSAIGSAPVLPSIEVTADAALSVEIAIPWEAFPPLDTLHFERFRWSLRVGARDPKRSNAAPTWTSAVLVTPRRYRLTECEYGLRGYAMSQDLDQVWFRPGPSDLVRQVVMLENPRSWPDSPGWQVSPSGKLTIRGASPRAALSRSWSHELEPGLWVCGPVPARRWQAHTRQLPPPFENRGGYLGPGSRMTRLGDGSWLVLSEPSSGVHGFGGGGGECGACLIGTVNAWIVSRDGIRQVRGLETHFDSARQIDDWSVEFSEDLRKAAVFERHNMDNAWTRTPYCLGADGYAPCGPTAPARRPRETQLRTGAP